jgi:hypothetical protein
VSEVVTINGVSTPSFGASAGEILSTNDGSFSAQYHFAGTETQVANSYTSYESADYYYAPNGSIPYDYTQLGTYTSADYSM